MWLLVKDEVLYFSLPSYHSDYLFAGYIRRHDVWVSQCKTVTFSIEWVSNCACKRISFLRANGPFHNCQSLSFITVHGQF